MKKASFLLFSGLGIVPFCLAPSAMAQSIRPGTEIKVHLVSKLDTGEAKDGQAFSATLAESVKLENKKVLARGTRVDGLVTEVVSSGRVKRPAAITLTLTNVDKTMIHTEDLQIDGKSHVLPPETELTFVIASRADNVVPRPESVVARNTERAPEPRPANWRNESNEDRDDAYDALIFSERDKWLIHSYFQSNYGNLPPGLANRGGDLPPGLEKRMRRDEILPPSLQDRMEPLPAELERRLPRLPSGYSRVVLSGRVMILQDDGQIVDLMFTYR
jgi:hypothetical protein